MMQYIKKIIFLFILGSLVVAIPQIKAMGSAQVDEYTVDFEALGYDAKSLRGPYDTTHYYFTPPAEWQLLEGATLQLHIMTAFSGSAIKDDTNYPAGSLEVFLNDIVIGTHVIGEDGEYNVELTIPPEALVTTREDGRHDLYVVLDSNQECRTSIVSVVTIFSDSAFVLPYELGTPPTDLSLFPYPIYQRSFLPHSALVVVPDEATAAEMKSALSIMAGLGYQTDGNLAVTLTTENALTLAQKRTNDLIVVGNIGHSSLINELLLPVPLTDDGLAQIEADPDDGILQLLLSPWSSANVVLVVSGATDEAVIKAGQAISEGSIRSNKRSDVAVITAVNPQLVQTFEYREQQTFQDLGYEVETLRGPGTDTTRYRFYIPRGYGKDKESFLDLYFAHSALLNDGSSGLSVRLNKELIGSARFDHMNAGLTDVHIPFPNSVLKTGWNELTIEASLFPYDVCADPERTRSWATIYPESMINLSLKEDDAEFNNSFVLSVYPEPFTLEPTLKNVAVVLPLEDLMAWQTAGTLLYDLGQQVETPLADFPVVFADAIPETLNAAYDWLVIGQPADLPILQTFQDDMPAPFIAGTNELVKSLFPVSYQIVEGEEVGFLELLRVPDDAHRMIITVLGNSDAGLQWAADKLLDATRYGLNGNFAIITESEVNVSMTTFEPLAVPVMEITETVTVPGTTTVIDAEETAVSPPPLTQTNDNESPNWLLPVLNGTIGLSVLIAVGVAIYYLVRWFRKRRTI